MKCVPESVASDCWLPSWRRLLPQNYEEVSWFKRNRKMRPKMLRQKERHRKLARWTPRSGCLHILQSELLARKERTLNAYLQASLRTPGCHLGGAAGCLLTTRKSASSSANEICNQK
eukprot:5671855-Amphidinium_carterae.1